MGYTVSKTGHKNYFGYNISNTDYKIIFRSQNDILTVQYLKQVTNKSKLGHTLPKSDYKIEEQ